MEVCSWVVASGLRISDCCTYHGKHTECADQQIATACRSVDHEAFVERAWRGEREEAGYKGSDRQETIVPFSA
eukprot:158066-Alexandrium_andersonii.AAC.1